MKKTIEKRINEIREGLEALGYSNVLIEWEERFNTANHPKQFRFEVFCTDHPKEEGEPERLDKTTAIVRLRELKAVYIEMMDGGKVPLLEKNRKAIRRELKLIEQDIERIKGE